MPFRYIETHAGAGRYDLLGEVALKTREHQGGVSRLLGAARLGSTTRVHLNLVRALNARNADQAGHHSSSPLVASLPMHEQNRAALSSFWRTKPQSWKAPVRQRRAHRRHHRDGYAALPGLVPAKERRGLVLIDPPFEGRRKAVPS